MLWSHHLFVGAQLTPVGLPHFLLCRVRLDKMIWILGSQTPKTAGLGPVHDDIGKSGQDLKFFINLNLLKD